MKQNPTIYKIDDDFAFEKVNEEVLEHLGKNGQAYKERTFELGEYEAKLIVIESSEKDSEWSSFLPTEHLGDISLEYKMPSLVLFIKTSSLIYAIVGGAFYKYILPFIDMSYGLNTYSRIMEPTKDQIISIKTRGLTGLRAGMQEQFKDNYRIMDYIKFGKIPTELKIKLSNEKVNLLFDKFVNSRSPYIILNISSGFNINKKLTYTELGDLIKILEYIEDLPADDFFSSYKEIVNKELISRNLKPGIISKLFDARQEILEAKISDFDICYPNKIEDFYSASEYLIKLQTTSNKFTVIGRTADKSDILRLILQFFRDKNYDRNLRAFSKKIYNVYILTYKENRKAPFLRTALIYHLNTELTISGYGTFIYLDSKWYKLREIFIDEMNSRCKEILQANNLNNTVLNEPWQLNAQGKRENEGVYNLKYQKQDYLVLDTIIIDSIELADVMYVHNDVMYLCHVKYGFSTDMRELYSQIISSARRLKNDMKDGNNPYLKSIFKQLENKGRNGNYTENDFLDLFMKSNSKIKYVMSITSHLSNRSIIDDIEKYSSNIAKLSLIQCFTEMRTEYFDMEFEIINNEECC